MLNDWILATATGLAAIGVGGLIVDELKAARAEGLSPDLGWILLWAIGLSALFVAAWAH